MKKILLGAMAVAAMVTAVSYQVQAQGTVPLAQICRAAGGQFIEFGTGVTEEFHCVGPINSKPSTAYGTYCNAALGFLFQNLEEDHGYWRCFRERDL